MIGPWCAACGQEAAVSHGAIAHAARRQWQRIGHSLWALAIHPGQLTAEFRDGRRARSVAPWRLAFNVIAVFFVLSFVTDFRVANFPRQDPSGMLANAYNVAAREAKVDEAAFMERIDRRFNAIYTVLVVPLVAALAVLARLTHLRSRERWSVHFVFALHLTAWSFIANVVYYVAMRLLGLTSAMTASDDMTRISGYALLALIISWQLGYVLLAFRRVYGDGWLGASARSVLMIVAWLFIANGMVFLSLWLAAKTV